MVRVRVRVRVRVIWLKLTSILLYIEGRCLSQEKGRWSVCHGCHNNVCKGKLSPREGKLSYFPEALSVCECNNNSVFGTPKLISLRFCHFFAFICSYVHCIAAVTVCTHCNFNNFNNSHPLPQLQLAQWSNALYLSVCFRVRVGSSPPVSVSVIECEITGNRGRGRRKRKKS